MSKTKIATFFPQRRCEVKLNAGGTGLLADKRVTLACVMDLSDGKLTGFPGWLQDEHALVSKEDSSTASTKNDAQLEGVELALFANDTQKEPVLKIQNVGIQGFKFARGKTKNNGQLGAVTLSFTVATLSFNRSLYDIVPDFIAGTFFMEFSGSQMSISFGKPTEEDQDDKPLETPQSKLPGTVMSAAPPEVKKTSTTGTAVNTPTGKQKRLSPEAQKAADVLDGKAPGKGRGGMGLVH